jgi:uncharacterized protein (TIGR03435 family)
MQPTLEGTMNPTTPTRAKVLTLALIAAAILPAAASAQTAFDVATIRPSSGQVQFERSGKTTFAYGTLTMRDVTVASCIELAYGVPQPIIKGPRSLQDVHYDIIAKTAPDTTKEQMHLMLQTLLTDRFHLAFHREQKELRAYTLTVMKGGIKIQPAPPGGTMSHENTATSFIAHSITMQEFLDYLAEPLGVPLTDETHLTARYDFVLDFKPYADLENNPTPPDPISFVNAALKDELGLELIKHQDQVNLLVVDHIDPPTSN